TVRDIQRDTVPSRAWALEDSWANRIHRLPDRQEGTKLLRLHQESGDRVHHFTLGFPELVHSSYASSTSSPERSGFFPAPEETVWSGLYSRWNQRRKSLSFSKARSASRMRLCRSPSAAFGSLTCVGSEGRALSPDPDGVPTAMVLVASETVMT